MLATDYFHKAKEIWLQLANDFPKYVEFSKNFKKVEKELEALTAPSKPYKFTGIIKGWVSKVRGKNKPQPLKKA